ncbi:substrate-binding periplasmic protein [Gynuella sunshinyii]|uniref:ABC-type amino acid transport/signal transduction system, periplasmic component/domain n=1 Tax=Gynuella sunshinyii YC6258 TaxID=1445510 RepID=A0A0C5VQD0_9GAMM|nr:transporter substrate-binding domain-containing protein [Gynuella sunshinyii]AJQ92489.1 ABC-type amino acid transport/signal transduction system, periplasmic component/domain [Gynuella sunshinyii YC6258]
MRKSICTVSLSLILLLLSLSAWSSSTVTLGVGYWPPYSDAALPYHGLLPRIASEALEAAGQPAEFQFEDWDNILKLLNKGQLQGSIGWIKTQERNERYYYSQPVIQITIVFLHRADMNFSWDNFEDLEPWKIGIVDSYSYGESFDRAVKDFHLNTVSTHTNEDNIEKLIKGDIDLVPVDLNVGEYLLHHKFSKYRQQLKFDEKNLTSETLYFITPKSMPSARQLTDTFNHGLSILRQTGQFQHIVENMAVVNSLAEFKFYSEQNGPMNYIDGDRPRGVVTHVLTAILNQIGADVTDDKFDFVPWSRAYREALNHPNVIVFSMTMTPERYGQFSWIGPIYRSNIVILGQPNLDPPKPHSASRICAVRDDVGHQQLLANGYLENQIELTSKAELCARMLISGRINFWVYGRDTSQWYLQRQQSDKSNFSEYQELTESSRYIGISLGSDPAVVAAFNRSFEYIKLNGELSRIIQLELQPSD